MLPVELSSSAGIFFIWPGAKFPVTVIFDLGNRERLGRVKVETVPFDLLHYSFIYLFIFGIHSGSYFSKLFIKVAACSKNMSALSGYS